MSTPRPRPVAAFLLVVSLLVLAAPGAAAATAPPGSAVTVSGTGAFAGLKVTVSQTTSLIDQVVTVTWTGGVKTRPANGQFLGDYLQIMQCWGDDPTGPRREQCQYGGLANRDSSDSGAWVRTRQVSYGNLVDKAETYRQQPGSFVPAYVPFTSVDGVTVPTGNSNQFFDGSTTNEIPLARTRADGTGEQFFEVQPATEAPGLGCGTPVGGATGAPRSCWLVIVPRGENEVNGLPSAASGNPGLVSSPLSESNWVNHLAVKLDFRPVGQNCPIGANERRLLGDEFTTEAMSSWQPALCANGGTVYGFSQVTDDLGRRHLVEPGDPGMVLLNGPVPPATVPPDRPVFYAPVAVSALTVAFFIERHADQTKPPDVLALDGQRFTELKLTPRLVAKLLTVSYQAAAVGQPAYLAHNAPDLTRDPDFLALNPTFADYDYGVYIPDALVAVDTSDAAVTLWNWIFADPDAKAFLSGTADPWGMTVNPHYQGLTPPVNNVPKNDLSCDNPRPPYSPICTLDAHPYANDMHSAAQAASRGDTLAKGHYDPSFPSLLQGAPRQLAGQRALLAVVDTATAARFSLPTAELRNASGAFVAPTPASMLATVGALSAGPVPGVLASNPSVSAQAAYPLAQVSYAATVPSALTAPEGADFAAFVRYAAGAGQQPGIQAGQLPPGYVPLPAALSAAALASAARIAQLAGVPASAATAAAAGTTTGTAGGSTLFGGTGAGGASAGSVGSAGTGSGGGAGGHAQSAPGAKGVPGAPARSAKPGNGVKPIAKVVDTPGSPVGLIRYALIALLVLGLVAGAAGPVLAWLGAGRARPS